MGFRREHPMINTGMLMRESITIVVEGSIPPTSYGYWITEKGEFVPTDYDGEHYVKVMAHFGDVAPVEYKTAMKAGWIRVVAVDGEISADTYGENTKGAAVRALMRLAREPNVEVWYHVDEVRNIQNRCASFQDFARSVRAAVAL